MAYVELGLLINLSGMITNFTFASTKINESVFAPDMLDNIKGLLGADKVLPNV